MNAEEREAVEQEISKLRKELRELQSKHPPRGPAERQMDYDWPIEDRKQRIRDLENKLRLV